MLNSCEHQPTIEDAARGKDPTKTYRLRAKFRAEGDRRWQVLARTVRQALVEHDLVGLRGMSRLPHGDKTEGFGQWLREELRQKVLGIDGRWTKYYVDQAAAAAYSRAIEMAPGVVVDPQRVQSLQSLAISELQGILAAAQQQITRVVTHCMMKNATPMCTANAAAACIRVMRNRTRAMSEYVVAKTHAVTTLNAFKSAGVTRVGIDPERRRKVRVVQSTHGKTLADRAPTSSDLEEDIEGAEEAEARLEALGEVDVLTAGDDDVCPECEEISDDGPYDIDEAMDLIPAHPWCRCAFVPTSDERFASVHDTMPEGGPMPKDASHALQSERNTERH